MSFLGVGIALQADIAFLELLKPLIERECDYFEITTETLWRNHGATIVPNVFHDLFQEIQQRSGKPFVAHGLGFSPGTALSEKHEQQYAERWIAQYQRDQTTFEFEWISEHLGYTRHRGFNQTLPLPLPPTLQSAQVVAEKMRLLHQVNPQLALETSVQPYLLGSSNEWVAFCQRICALTPCQLILDLHNLYTDSQNFGFDPFEVLEQFDGTLVLEIHISGGSLSEPQWVSSGRQFRLDSHDGLVPEPVWELVAIAMNRCPNLRGVIWERLNGTFTAEDVPSLTAEFERLREIVDSRKSTLSLSGSRPGFGLDSQLVKDRPADELVRELSACVRNGFGGGSRTLPDLLALAQAAHIDCPQLSRDAVELTALVVAKLRMERLVSGHSEFRALMAADPAEASSQFQEYRRAVPPTALWPDQEASAFDQWRKIH